MLFEKITTFENILSSYGLARKGNRFKKPVLRFNFFLESNLLKLQAELLFNLYQPSPYTHFVVTDPKERNIAAPDFRDRVLQHSLVSLVEPIFERSFINDSYACRKVKGTHFALKRTKKFLQAGRTYFGKEAPIYYLKADIQRFFSSISWDILLSLIKKKINCPKTMALIEKIITCHQINRQFSKNGFQLSLFEKKKDFEEVISVRKRRGLPIGNLTSQLFANVYLNELDHFVKEVLRERWYGRYMDDFFIIHQDKKHLKIVREKIRLFLAESLNLKLHPHKTVIQNAKNGLAFVGYRVFYDHILIRGSTLLRMQRKLKIRKRQYERGEITKLKLLQTINSFKGHFKHANSWRLKKMMFKNYPALAK